MTSAPGGILFDFGGALSDTIEGHYRAWKTALQAHIYCIAVCATISWEVLSEADEILERFKDIIGSVKFGQFFVTKIPHA